MLAAVGVLLLSFGSGLGSTPVLAAVPAPTALGAAAALLSLTYRIADQGVAVIGTLTPVVVLWVCFLPGLALAGTNEYATTKATGLFIWTLVAAATAVMWGGEPAFQRYLVLVFVIFGTLIWIAGLVSPNPDVGTGVSGTNSIGYGRATGVAIVAIVALLLSTRRQWRRPAIVILVPLAGLLVVAAAANDNRGTLLGIALAVAVLCATQVAGWRRVAALAVLCLFVVWFWVTRLRSSAFSSLIGEQVDASVLARQDLWQWSLSYMATHPLGVGWGNLVSVLPNSVLLSSGDAQYSHNLVVESFVEGGWIAGLALVVFLGALLTGMWRTRSVAGASAVTALHACTLLLLVSALVSGDLVANRVFFAFAFASFAATRATIARVA